MPYDLTFKPSALKEWHKLGSTIREQFKKKLAERLESPHVPADALASLENCYKIKLRASGYRLVYQVKEQELIVDIVTVGKRNRKRVYQKAKGRI